MLLLTNGFYIGVPVMMGCAVVRAPRRLPFACVPEGVEVTDEEVADVNLIEDAFHGEWNSATTA